ncbi:hypothetical protein Vretifemale_17016, partial [Volvox reticuliferus]
YRNDRDAALTNLTLLGTFARTARELLLGQPSAAVLAALAAVPKQLMEQAVSGGMPEGVSAALEQLRAEQQQLQEELDRRFVLPDAEAAVLTKVLDRALEAAMAALTEDHRQLRDLKAEISTLPKTRRKLPVDVEYERRRKVYEALHRAVVALADGLGREMPEGVSAALEQLRAEQQQLQEELDRRFVLPDAEAAVLTKVLDRALEAAMAALTEDHRQLRDLKAEISTLPKTRRKLPVDVEYERRRKVYEALHRAVVALADGLGREMPEVAEDAFTRLGLDHISEAAAKDASTSGAPSGAGDSAFEPVFEDPKVRSFYESLPDLRVLVPSVLLFGDPKDPRGRDEEDHQQQASDDKHKSKDGSGGGGSVAGAEAAATVSSAQDGGADSGDDVATDVDSTSPPVVEDSATAQQRKQKQWLRLRWQRAQTMTLVMGALLALAPG